MVISILIMYIVFPATILYNIRAERNGSFNKLIIQKNESNCLRGIAALMVVFAHYIIWVEKSGIAINMLLPFKFMGPLGVGIFFFLSGYGLQVSDDKIVDFKFLIHRIQNVIIPYIILRAVELFLLHNDYDFIKGLLFIFSIINPAWFINVLLFFYLAYWVLHKLVKQTAYWMIVLSVLISVILYLLNFEDYWYTANLLFPTGMLFCKYKDKILSWISKRYISHLLCNAILFFCCSLLFLIFRDRQIGIVGKILAILFLVNTILIIMMKFHLNSKPMIVLGKMSLYIYIIHPIVFEMILKNYYLNEFSLVILIVITMLLSYLLYTVILKLNNIINKRLSV